MSAEEEEVERRKLRALYDIYQCVLHLKFKEIKDLVKKAIEAGATRDEIIRKGLVRGVTEVSERYHIRVVGLPQLIVSTHMFDEAIEILKESMAGEVPTKGTVVLGVVRYDLHTIGKNLVKSMLRVGGYKVVDLGSNVPAEKFVEAVKKYKADIVAMSALMTTTMPEMENTIKVLKEAGIRDKVKVIVGGAPLTPDYANEIGADGYGKDCIEALELANRLMGEP